MSKFIAVVTAVAAVMAASPSFAESDMSNRASYRGGVHFGGSYAAEGGASYETVSPTAPSFDRQFRVPAPRPGLVTIQKRESGASKRG